MLEIKKEEFYKEQIERAQKAVWNLKTEIRLLERGKLSAGQSKLADIQKAININKNQIDYWEKRIDVLKDQCRELTGEELKIKLK